MNIVLNSPIVRRNVIIIERFLKNNLVTIKNVNTYHHIKYNKPVRKKDARIRLLYIQTTVCN